MAVFLDRDGTVNEERGYIVHLEDMVLLPGAGEAIRRFNQLGFLTILITNQAPLSKGLLSLEVFESINQKLWDGLEANQAHYDALYFCPHTGLEEEKCVCRKPQPGLIFQASRDYRIDLERSFVIGDKVSDIEAGKRSGCKTILVLTGRGEQSIREIEEGHSTSPDFICENLAKAVAWIETQS